MYILFGLITTILVVRGRRPGLVLAGLEDGTIVLWDTNTNRKLACVQVMGVQANAWLVWAWIRVVACKSTSPPPAHIRTRNV